MDDPFSFTLMVDGLDVSTDRFVDELYEAGCRDALVSMSNGRVMLDFDRIARSYDDAVKSAMGDVKKAGGRVVGVEPIQTAA